ncbi:MAG: fibro-slime domain-containing protein [Lachnospiraceae bacterium]|jgi:fibro-slime domain-containing protein/LPXTG-motif cell wall-anchored protein|nr:fibro-slime domain-containing protein [Lachnospiraceae bacterium]
MNHDTSKRVEKFVRKNKSWKRWQKAVGVLSCAVILGVAGVMMIPGISMERKDDVLECVFAVHTHTEECMNEEGSLICGQADYVVHVHEENCYGADGAMRCALPEIEAHTHEGACYEEHETLTCELEESEGHIHTDACYEEEKKLICEEQEQEVHTHTNECVSPDPVYNCAPEEGEEHTHTEECISQDPVYICEQEQSEAHVHTDECYEIGKKLICESEEGQGAHTHTDECYSKDQVLTCEREEIIPHQHNDSCYEERETEEEGEMRTVRVLVCTQTVVPEHQHEKGCFHEVESAEPAEETGEETEESESVEDSEASTENVTEDQTEEESSETETADPQEKKDSIEIDDEFIYDSDTYTLKLHVRGLAGMPKATETDQNESPVADQATDGETVGDTQAENADNDQETVESSDEAETGSIAETAGAETQITEENTAASEEETQESATEGENGTEEAKLRLEVRELDMADAICGEMAGYLTAVKNVDTENDLIDLSVLEFHVYRADEELDLSGCEVIAQVTPKAVTEEELARIAGEESDPAQESGIAVALLQQNENGIAETETVRLTGEEEELPVLHGTLTENRVLGMARYEQTDVKDDEKIDVDDVFTYTMENYVVTWNIRGQVSVPEDESDDDKNVIVSPETEESKEPAEEEASDPAETQTAPKEETEPESMEGQADDVQEEGSLSDDDRQPETGTVQPENLTRVGNESGELELAVRTLDSDSDLYRQLEAYFDDADETAAENRVLDLSVLEARLYLGETEVDLSDCSVTVQVTPKAALEEELKEALGEHLAAREGVKLHTSILSQDENGVRESESAELTADETEIPVLECEMPESGILALARYIRIETVDVDVDSTFVYEAEDFSVTLNIQGTASYMGPEEDKTEERPAGEMIPETESQPETVAADETEPETEEETREEVPESQETQEEPKTQEIGDGQETSAEDETVETDESETGEGDEEAGDSAETEEVPDKEKDRRLMLEVVTLEKENPVYEEISSIVAEDAEVEGEWSDLSVLEFHLHCDGQELDLNDCKVTAQVTPKEQILDKIEEAPEEAVIEDLNTGMLLSVMSGNEEELEEVGSLFLTGEEEEIPEMEEMVLENNLMVVAQNGQVANPKFKVQYYAYTNTVSENGLDVAALYVIDTSGGKLPQNGAEHTIKKIFLDVGSNLDANGKPLKNRKYPLLTESVLTEMYDEKEYEYIIAPNLAYFNRLYENGNYTLKEIWIWKGTGTVTSIDEADWMIYGREDDVLSYHFTNRAVSAGNDDKLLLIEENTVIRLVFDESTSLYNNAVNFYDYDITDGKLYKSEDIANSGTYASQNEAGNNTIYANTNNQGINSNYNGKGTMLAFGNNNAQVPYGSVEWDDEEATVGRKVVHLAAEGADRKETTSLKSQTLNKGNDNNADVNKCTFNLVKGLSSEGKIIYSAGVAAPNLFNDGTAAGKEVIVGNQNEKFSLNFNRSGDTYTFTGVTGTSAQELEYLAYITEGWSSKLPLWTNNYWPMDQAETYGAAGHDLKFGNKEKADQRKAVGLGTSSFPASDDGQDHNSYFGMQFEVQFNLTEDYVGPLEYYFFGDDDMWVFLDGTLVCDIGGVHPSMGEYVNLWDYIEKGSEGEHKLSFFYTERGASGSTCYMRFTLPSVSSITPEQNTGKLRIEKDAMGLPDNFEYEFEINFTDKDGNNLPDDYSYTRFKKNPDGTDEVIKSDVIVFDGGKFELREGEYIIVNFLPDGTRYTIRETGGHIINEDGSKGNDISELFKPFYQVNGNAITEGDTVTGTIVVDREAAQPKEDVVQYVNQKRYKLPETGGAGTIIFTIGGILLLSTGALYSYDLRRRRSRKTLNQ